jgi:hypothetical protein
MLRSSSDFLDLPGLNFEAMISEDPRGFSDPIIPRETWSYIVEPSLKRQSETRSLDRFVELYSTSRRLKVRRPQTENLPLIVFQWCINCVE